MNAWICTKCGETASSKCVSQRTVFPSDQMAAVMSYIYGYNVKVGPHGEYVNGQRIATTSLTLNTLESQDDARDLEEIELQYVSKPYMPHCNIPAKPIAPVKLNRQEFYNENACWDSHAQFLYQYKLYCKEYKSVKAMYETSITEWECLKLEHEVAMAEYNEQFNAWMAYEAVKEEVHEHNYKARLLWKTKVKEMLKRISEIKDSEWDHWLCNHDWVLSKNVEGNKCSLGCTHRKEV